MGVLGNWLGNRIDTTFFRYLVVFALSVATGLIGYFLGGKAATISGEADTLAGVTFQASGFVAVFALVFWLSWRSLERAHVDNPLEVRFLLTGFPKFSDRRTYQAACTVTQRSPTGEKEDERQVVVRPTVVGNVLKMAVPGIHINDEITATITDDEGTSWVVAAQLLELERVVRGRPPVAGDLPTRSEPTTVGKKGDAPTRPTEQQGYAPDLRPTQPDARGGERRAPVAKKTSVSARSDVRTAAARSAPTRSPRGSGRTRG